MTDDQEESAMDCGVARRPNRIAGPRHGWMVMLAVDPGGTLGRPMVPGVGVGAAAGKRAGSAQ